MPNLKNIKMQINSVSNTQKITKALEVVSKVRLQKIKQQTENYRAFMIEFLKLINFLRTKMNIFNTHKIDKTLKSLVVVVSTDKWLCGSMNSKIFKHIFQQYWSKKDKTDVFCVWKKWFEFLTRLGFSIKGYIGVKDSFLEDDLDGLYKFIMDGIDNNKYSEVKIYFNFYKNTITQVPLRFKLFPIDQDTFDKFVENIWLNLDEIFTQELEYKDLIIEPDEKTFKRDILRQLTQHMIYGAVLLNKAWEFSSRMIAMESANDNAANLIKDLSLKYNKARQFVITQEVSEIIAAKMAIWD